MDLVATIRDDTGQSVGAVVVPAKHFDSGSDGWFGQRKVRWNDVRYQIQVQVVRIGSAKENAEAAEAEA